MFLCKLAKDRIENNSDIRDFDIDKFQKIFMVAHGGLSQLMIIKGIDEIDRNINNDNETK